jgi:hypothetical protein
VPVRNGHHDQRLTVIRDATASVTNVLSISQGSNRIRWQTNASLRYDTSLETFWIKNKGV